MNKGVTEAGSKVIYELCSQSAFCGASLAQSKEIPHNNCRAMVAWQWSRGDGASQEVGSADLANEQELGEAKTEILEVCV